MPSRIDVAAERGCVEVGHTGRITLAELRRVRKEAVEVLKRHGLSRLLVDGRAADVSALSILDVYDFSSTHASVLPPSLRTAIIINTANFDSSVFAETVARNRGTNIRMFLAPDEARRWLGMGPDKRSAIAVV